MENKENLEKKLKTNEDYKPFADDTAEPRDDMENNDVPECNRIYNTPIKKRVYL